ncbi:MAG TPA: hypothetical protein VFI17_00845 [Solirubrobacterales bacterium]|nr:hypothetical protein [Solirubrobacterales bacterium]
MTRSRHAQTVCIVFVAFLFMAASAHASPTFEISGGGEAEVKGTQKTTHVLSIEGNNTECPTVTMNSVGKISNGATTAALHPEYSKCTAFGFIAATVTTTGCNYRLMASGTSTGSPPHYIGEVAVECEAGKEIVISAGGVCEAKFGSQTLTSGPEYTDTIDINGFADWDLIEDDTEISVNKTQDGFGCPFNGTGKATAIYNGVTTNLCTRPAGTPISCKLVN